MHLKCSYGKCDRILCDRLCKNGCLMVLCKKGDCFTQPIELNWETECVKKRQALMVDLKLILPMAEDKLKALSASRRGKLVLCMQNEWNQSLACARGKCWIGERRFASFQMLLNKFNEIHDFFQMGLFERAKGNGRIDWYEPKMSTFKDFLEVKL